MKTMTFQVAADCTRTLHLDTEVAVVPYAEKWYINEQANILYKKIEQCDPPIPVLVSKVLQVVGQSCYFDRDANTTMFLNTFSDLTTNTLREGEWWIGVTDHQNINELILYNTDADNTGKIIERKRVDGLYFTCN